MSKALFSLMGGLFLVVLIPENLVYLGVPVRISAWLILGVALVLFWSCRRKFASWIGAFYANADLRTLGVIILLTSTFHGIVPIRQGLEWYYGKGHFDQINNVLLAEFLKEEPYGTSEQDIGLRPWLVRPVGFQDTTRQLGVDSGPGVEMLGLKKERIGQSIITAEISVWSGTDAKGGYAATVIFFLTVPAICLYAVLRETGIDRFMAGSGALLAALLPVVTSLSLNGFLSHVSVLFIFPFFASLLRHEELSARSFTLFFSLTLAYLVAAYSDFTPIGFFTFFLSVMFVRRDTFRVKRLMLMSAVLLVPLMNPFYLRNLIEYLGLQYYFAAYATALDISAPDVVSLHGWSELIFGVITSAPFALLFDGLAIVLALLFLAGVILLSRRDKLIFGTILSPAVLVILYLASRTPPPAYPIAKITITILPFVIGLVFVTLSRVAAIDPGYVIGVLVKLLSAFIVAVAGTGSVGYYSEVLRNEDLLTYVREPHFLNVCRELEEITNKRVFVFETSPLLASWLCYHARHNNVYFDGRHISDSPVPPSLPFSEVPDVASVDFVATRDRVVDLKEPGLSCLTSVDDTPGEDRRNGRDHYWIGPPARLRFLALRPMSATLKMRLGPGPEGTIFPIDYFLTDAQGHVLPGELWGKNVEVLRVDLPKGLSYLELSVKAKESDPAGPSFPLLAELDGFEISDIDLNPDK